MEAAAAAPSELPPPSFKKSSTPHSSPKKKKPFNRPSHTNHATNAGTSSPQENGNQKRVISVAKTKQPFPRAQTTSVPDPLVSPINNHSPSTPTSEPRVHSSQSKPETAVNTQEGSQVAQLFKAIQQGNLREFSKNQRASRRGGRARNGRQRPTELDDTPDPDADKKVLVSGFPAYTQATELSRVMSEIGPATVVRCRNRLAVVAFDSPIEAAAALAADGELYIYGELLTVRPYTTPRHVEDMFRSRKKVFTKEKEDDLIDPHKIDLSGDFEQQLSNVLSAVRLTHDEAAAVETLCRDLDDALATLWPGCRTVPFGSIPTGLGTKSSDADCYVSGVPAGEAGAFVARARRALAARPQLFARLVPIPRANTPILKLVHAPTGRRCDLSAKTPLGTQNSRLLRALLGADPRLPPLGLALKYWARVHRLTGTGRLSNYALALLLLHYLQQPHVALAPPVAALQGPLTALLVDHWDAGFRDPPPPPPAAAPAPLPRLLGGFFEYYARFDFDRLVVCPLTGAPLPRAAFEDPARLPQQMARYCDNVAARRAGPLRTGTALCVQDPFELSHNVACGVTARLAERLRAGLAHAAALYAREAPACAGLLRGVLLTAPPPPRAVAPWTARVCVVPRAAPALAAAGWRVRVRAALLDTVFARMLRLPLRPLTPAEEDAAAADAPADVERERYGAVARHVAWRRPRERPLPADFVAAHERLADKLLGETSCELRFQLELWWREQPRACHAVARLEDGRADLFHGLVKFMHSTMLEWLQALLRAPVLAPAPHRDVPAASPAHVSAEPPADVSAAPPSNVSAEPPSDVSTEPPADVSAASPPTDLSRRLAAISVVHQPS